MDGLLKKTINYINQEVIVQDEFVGKIVEVAAIKLKILRKIAEGGFAIVYVARDIQSGVDYALKRLFGSDKDECNNIIREINIHKQVSGHPNIVKFIAASFIDQRQSSGRAEYLLVTELCKGGSLYDCLDQQLEPPTVLKIIYQATRAVAHLHSLGINHRDIKVENFLIGSDGLLKLCDFGSATTENHSPDITWTAQQRNALEELLQKFTTPMYRSPEQLDTWNNYPIGVKTDVWALGCILFCLCYKKHPFEDGAKLRIINGNYTIPSDSRFMCYNEIIKGSFAVDPSHRFDVNTVLERLGAVSETKDWSLKGSLDISGKPLDSPTQEILQSIANINASQQQPPSRPPPPRPSDTPRNSLTSQTQPQIQSLSAANVAGGSLFSSLKGGAGSFLKNLKETSTKVMHSVQQSMARSDLDATYITQRIIVMPFPTEGFESAYKTNHIEDVKLFLEQRYQPSKISVYSMGPRCPRLPPPVRTVECPFGAYQSSSIRCPNLTQLYSVAADMYGFLTADPKNIIIVQSADGGRSAASTVIGALMIFAQLIREPEDALQMFAVKRTPPNVRPSELRYLYYSADLIRSHFPHYYPITLVNMIINPVPRMTKAKDGVRLYIEVTANDQVVLSTLQDHDRMKLFHISEGRIHVPLNVTVCGDITISLFHARNLIGRIQGHKVCQLQFHSGFIPEEETLLSFNRSELDDVPDVENIPNNFNLSLSVFVGDDERLPNQQPPWVTNAHEVKDAKVLFGSQLEYEENIDNFITQPVNNNNNESSHAHIPPPRPVPPVVQQVVQPRQLEPPLLSDFKDEPEPVSDTVENKEFDLLNLGNSATNEKPKLPREPEQPKLSKTKEPSFDLLGGFDSNFQDPFPDLVGSALNKPTQPVKVTSSGNDLDDIFGAIPQTSVPLIPPSKSSNDLNGLNMNFNSSRTTKPEVKDPFADLASSLNPEWKTATKTSPAHQFNQPEFQATSRNNVSTPLHNIKSPTEPKKPDYSRSHFQDKAEPAQKSKPTDIFGDILGSQGYSFGSKGNFGPKSINDMRKVEQAQTMDPEKLKVMEWTEGKKGNIRALICSVHTILWQDAKWTKCDMSQLISANEVKKAYRKCCLAVHPDKHVGKSHENLAKMIFMELNNAFSEFENDATKQNLF